MPAMDYKVFDSFLSIDTWHTSHDADGERFFRALHGVVKNPNFNPDAMADYMKAKHPHEGFQARIDDLRAAAWAVKEYLAANSL